MIKILNILELKKLTNDGKTEELKEINMESKGIEEVNDIGGCKIVRKINLSKNKIIKYSGLQFNYQLT